MTDPVRILTSTRSPAELAKAARKAASAAALSGRCHCLVEVDLGREPSPTMIGSKGAARLASSINDGVPDCRAVVRGRLCLVTLGPEDWLERCGEVLDCLGPDLVAWIAVTGTLYGESVQTLVRLAGEVVLVLEGREGDPNVAELARAEAAEVGIQAVGQSREGRDHGSPRDRRAGLRGIRSRLRNGIRTGAGDGGQATLLTIGACFGAITLAVALLAVAGAVTGKGRAQRTADLSALSAARSMRDDLPRLLAPPTLPNGAPNPVHMPKPVYLARATMTARRVATSNGGSPVSVTVRFPDATSFAPLTVRVAIPVRLEGGSGSGSGPVRAEARIGIALSAGGGVTRATGGGYSGPLVMRQGHGMRPDVASAFDLMATAAAASGVSLVINSGFRSDAEQARLFSANPDPRWVAPPGRSLHRCATELDIGPPSAYGWLATNAGRFGFTRRYSWEPWHFGFTAGPAPCSAAGEGTAGRRPSPESARSRAGVLPEWVPRRYLGPILRASLRSGVPAILLAAQLKAESDFDPGVVSSAGAMGIAQFMPATAASYGLRDPFDPEASIAAQARMMSELLGRFGSPALALAAYNAGPGAVGSCNCIPPYPETRAYVTRILGLVGGLGSLSPPGMEVELVQ